MKDKIETPEVPGFQPSVLALRNEIAAGSMRLIKTLAVAGCRLEVREGSDSVWVCLQRPERGGFALRAAYAPGGSLRVEVSEDKEDRCELQVITTVGMYRVELTIPNAEHRLFRCKTALKPGADLVIPYWPRDLYPLDAKGDPTAAAGVVHAAQRGLNTGLVYLTMDKPEFGALLYLQNFTALNEYFNLTGTIPDGRVGGQWPELGYLMPVSEQKSLPRRHEVVLSDVYLHWTSEIPRKDDANLGRIFLDLLAGIYQHLDRPPTLFHDWPQRAAETLRDLEHAPEATVKKYGATFLHPYTDAEYPDSMVQLTVLMPIREYGSWLDNHIPLADQLRKGVPHFYDPELKTIRRYLPSVGKDKNPNEVDSWYLYHPLANMGRLAMEGDKDAKQMFLNSLDYAINVARHFEYKWPVQFDVTTLEVIKGDRKPSEPGQSDAGGLYAYVMLQAWHLTEQKRYLEEAKKAIAAMQGLEFSINYQSNITAWGANACIWLWRITSDDLYKNLSFMLLASFFHNSLLYESQMEAAKHYRMFLGVTCLHDGPYMALYECFESYAAFHEYLSRGHDDLPESVRLLLTEYCKYTLTRAWFYFPSELPEEILSKEVRNGHIDRKLAFPLEDLYADGQPPGQVGQEIYGCGAAFVFATRAYHRLRRAPFTLYCEYPLFDLAESDEPCIDFQIRGLAQLDCRVRIIPAGNFDLSKVRVLKAGLESVEIEGEGTPEGHWQFTAPGDSRIEIRWANSQADR